MYYVMNLNLKYIIHNFLTYNIKKNIIYLFTKFYIDIIFFHTNIYNFYIFMKYKNYIVLIYDYESIFLL